MAVEQGDPGTGAPEAQLFLRTTCSRLGNTFIAGAGVLPSKCPENAPSESGGGDHGPEPVIEQERERRVLLDFRT